jgi:heme-degrading monooxygenase HmoA
VVGVGSIGSSAELSGPRARLDILRRNIKDVAPQRPAKLRGSQVDEQRQPMILINAFEVPPDKDDEFIRGWEAARDFLQTQAGYVDTALHRAVSPDADFRFVNVARWESPQHFQAAIQSDGFREASQGLASFPPHPALYEVVRT